MNWFNDYYIGVLRDYADFSGRSGRKEFWVFVLISFLISVALGLLGSTVSSLYSLLVLIPSIAVGVRRLHDIGKSGWYLFLVLIPVLGWLVLLYFYVQKGSSGSNTFGSHPAPLS